MATSTYRYETANHDGFVAQLVRYVASGHYFYITGKIPEQKNPKRIDEKLLALYQIAQPKWRRARRQRAGVAGIHYLRHERFFVIIATHGKHRFFDDHLTQVHDVRRTAIKFGGYSIRYTFSQLHLRWKVFVRLEQGTYRDVEAYLLRCSTKPQWRKRESMEAEFQQIRFQPYEPVRQQLLAILRKVNRRRRYAGYERISPDCIPRLRRLGETFVQAAPIREGKHSLEPVTPANATKADGKR